MARQRHNKRDQAPDGQLTKRALTETVSGVKIRLDYYENVDDGMKDSYRLDEIRAIKDGREAGYIKIAYVDQERAQKYASSPFEYRMYLQGHYYGLQMRLEKGIEKEDLPKKDLPRILFDVYPGYASPDLQRSWREMTREELIAELDKYIDAVNKEYHQQWLDFREYAIDKPYVDFIRVYDQQEVDRNKGLTLGSHIGLGQLLYEAASEWMAERGLMLYASTLQSPQAERAWSKLEARHTVVTVEMAGDYTQNKTRRYLDGTNIQIPGQKIDLTQNSNTREHDSIDHSL